MSRWLPLLLLSCAKHEPGEGKAKGLSTSTGFGYYADNDELTIYSPRAGVTGTLGEYSGTAGWTADVISAATIDVVTSATRGFQETRQEASLEGQRDSGDRRVGASWIGSIEPDTSAHTASLSASQDLLQDNVALGMSYGYGLARLGTHQEPSSMWRPRTTHHAELTWAQVLSKSSVGSLTYTFQHNSGFLSSPYRMVPLFPSDEALWDRAHAQFIPEVHPDQRVRHALAGELRHALTPHLFLRDEHRAYLDTWAMRAHTNELGLGLEISDRFYVELMSRTHWQSRVSFYRSTYTVTRDYMTLDRRLAGQLIETGGLKLAARQGRLQGEVRGSLAWTRYADAVALIGDDLLPVPDNLAFVAEAGLSFEF